MKKNATFEQQQSGRWGPPLFLVVFFASSFFLIGVVSLVFLSNFEAQCAKELMTFNVEVSVETESGNEIFLITMELIEGQEVAKEDFAIATAKGSNDIKHSCSQSNMICSWKYVSESSYDFNHGDEIYIKLDASTICPEDEDLRCEVLINYRVAEDVHGSDCSIKWVFIDLEGELNE